MNRDKVIIVNNLDEPLGEMEKMQAHVEGVLHRAFSVFLFNQDNEMLIHQRAGHKYHGANLWTNACCSHPQLNEDTKSSALERLQFEMGMNTDIEKIFSFIYKAQVENGLMEHELDHVFVGYTDEIPNPNSDEVQDWRWIQIPVLLDDMDRNPQHYTFWFKKSIRHVLDRVYPSTLFTV